MVSETNSTADIINSAALSWPLYFPNVVIKYFSCIYNK